MRPKRQPKVPEYPITDEQVAEFKRLLEVWRERLHLKDWRVVVGKQRPASVLADVCCDYEHRIARVRIGRDWGSNAPGPNAVEEIVVHELLHVRLRELASLALHEETLDRAVVDGVEHGAIVPLTETLVALSTEIERLKSAKADTTTK